MAIGMLEVQGFSIALEAADAMCKAANVKVEAFDANNPSSPDVKIPVIVQVKIEGGISDVQAALETGRSVGEKYLNEAEVITRCIPAVSEELRSLVKSGKLQPTRQIAQAPKKSRSKKEEAGE